jgi:hypothetical protein
LRRSSQSVKPVLIDSLPAGVAGAQIRHEIPSAFAAQTLLSTGPFARLGAMVDRRGRRVALSNLRVAFDDEISSERLAQLVRESYQHLPAHARFFLEPAPNESKFLAFSGKTLESTLRPRALHSERYWIFFETRATNSSNLKSKASRREICSAFCNRGPDRRSAHFP